MSIFPAPKCIIEKIVQLQRRFLRSENLEKKLLPPMAWDLSILPKSLGGLRIGDLKSRNHSLMFKWLCRYLNEPKMLWRRLIEGKYNFPNVCSLSDLPTTVIGGPWIKICNSIFKNPKNKSDCWSLMEEVNWWWHEYSFLARSLESSSPSQIKAPKTLLSIFKQARIRGFIWVYGLSWRWNFEWRWPLWSWELTEEKQLLALIKNVYPA